MAFVLDFEWGVPTLDTVYSTLCAVDEYLGAKLNLHYGVTSQRDMAILSGELT